MLVLGMHRSDTSRALPHAQITYSGEIQRFDASRPFLFGRGSHENDLNLERSEDVHMHRRLGRIFWRNVWHVANDGSNAIVVADKDSGSWIHVDAGRSTAVSFDQATIIVRTLRNEPYEIDVKFFSVDGEAFTSRMVDVELSSGPETMNAKEMLQGNKRLATVALAEPVLRDPRQGFVPRSNRQVAEGIGVPEASFVQYVKGACALIEQVSRIEGLVGFTELGNATYRRLNLVFYCINAGIIDSGDLRLLEEHRSKNQ